MLKTNKISEKKIKVQTLSVGLDVHDKQWAMSIMGDGVFYCKGLVVEPNSKQIKKYIDQRFEYKENKLVYEAGFCGFWIQRELQELGIDASVVNPADIPTSDKDAKNKTDKRDSKTMAKTLNGGLLEPIYVPTEQEEERHQYIVRRNDMVKKRIRIKNQIKALLKKHGIKEEGLIHWSEKYKEAIIESIKKQRPALLSIMKGMIEELEFYEQKIAAIDTELEEMISQSELKDDYIRLQKIPGIGKTTSVTFLFDLYNINRFKNFRCFASYIGLIPTEHSSGEKIRKGHITRRGKGKLKSMLIEAAWISVSRDETMKKYYHIQLGRGVKPQQAIIKCAKKLLSRMFHILKTGEEYKIEIAA